MSRAAGLYLLDDTGQYQLVTDPSALIRGSEAIRAAREAGREAGALAERGRVEELQALLTEGAEGFEEWINGAIDDGTSPDALASRIVAEQRDRGVTLADLAAEAAEAPHGGAGSNGSRRGGSVWQRAVEKITRERGPAEKGARE